MLCPSALRALPVADAHDPTAAPVPVACPATAHGGCWRGSVLLRPVAAPPADSPWRSEPKTPQRMWTSPRRTSAVASVPPVAAPRAARAGYLAPAVAVAGARSV